MNRRIFLKSMASTATLAAFSSLPGRVWAAPENYEGRFLVVMQMDGGWMLPSCVTPKQIRRENPILTIGQIRLKYRQRGGFSTPP